MSYEGTHYAGLSEIAVDAKTGLPMQVIGNVAQNASTNKHAKGMQKPKSHETHAEDLQHVLHKGVVCNELMASSAAAAQISNIPASISGQNWKKYQGVQDKDEPGFFKMHYNEIEQGDFIVSLDDKEYVAALEAYKKKSKKQEAEPGAPPREKPRS